MAKFDFKAGLSKLGDGLKTATQTIKETDFKKVAEQAASSVQNAASDLKYGIEHFNAEDAQKQASAAAQNAGQAIKQYFTNDRETQKMVNAVLTDYSTIYDCLLVEDACKIMYYMICADGVSTNEELDSFGGMVSAMNPPDNVTAESIALSCALPEKRMEGVTDLEYIQDGISDAIHHSSQAKNGTIKKSLLLWNLLVIAHSDGSYSEEEQSILRLITRRLEVPVDMIQEMEQAINAMQALSAEEESLENCNRSYKEIAPRIAELKKRKDDIMQGIHALLADE